MLKWEMFDGQFFAYSPRYEHLLRIKENRAQCGDVYLTLDVFKQGWHRLEDMLTKDVNFELNKEIDKLKDFADFLENLKA